MAASSGSMSQMASMALTHFIDIVKKGIGNVPSTPSPLVLINGSGWEEVKTINSDPVSSAVCPLFQGGQSLLCFSSLQ